MSNRALRSKAHILLGVFAAIIMASTPSVAAASSREQRLSPLARQVGAQYRSLTSEIVHGYASSSARNYASGVWQNGDPSCWYCNVGPAAGAAFLAATEPSMLPLAVESLNRAIAEYRQPDGSFSAGPGAAIPSASFAVVLGLAYVRLAPQLDEATRVHWQQTLTGIADYLIADKDVTWYANGNINCSYAAALYFAWRASGGQSYLDAYNAELQFVVAPTGSLWAGFGLQITQPPTQATGSDGRGFLTEGSPPGWDPEYTHLQLDFLSVLYSASHDPRALRLLNLLLNQELTRVDPSSFMLNATEGTRKNDTLAFTSAALPLLVLDGKRPDLAPLMPAAFARLSSEYLATLSFTQHNFYRGVALWLSPILLATSNMQAVIPPGSSTPLSPASAPAAIGEGTDAATGSASAPAAPAPTVPEQAPSVPPNALGGKRLVQVPGLDMPDVEYAFAVPATLARGIAVRGAARKRLSLAAFACRRACRLSIRPLLVIHGAGERSPVAIQSYLASSHVSVKAGQLFTSRVQVPAVALKAARAGRAVFVRLIVTMLTRGSPLQGRSAMFKIMWR